MNTIGEGRLLMKSPGQQRCNNGSWHNQCGRFVCRYVTGADPHTGSGLGASRDTAWEACLASGPILSTDHRTAPRGSIGWYRNRGDEPKPGHVVVHLTRGGCRSPSAPLTLMSDDAEQNRPQIPRMWDLGKVPKPVDMAAILAEQEKRMTAAERALRDMQRGIPPFPETRAEKAFREVKLGIGAPEAYWKSAIPTGFSSRISALMNAAAPSATTAANAAVFAQFNGGSPNALATAAATMSTNAFAGIGSSIGKDFSTFTPSISATALAGLKSSVVPAFNTGALASASLQAAAASYLPKLHTDQFLSSRTFSAVQAAQLSALKFDFGAMTDRPAGVLGRFDSALHADPGLGAAVDSLIAAPNRHGPLGFDYGAVQRRTREVDNLLSENPASADLADAVEEAQEITGLDDDVMDGLSIFLGVPPPGLAVGPTATRILFIATVGTACVISDVAMGQVVTLTGLIGIILNGAAVWALLHKGGEGE